MKLKDIHEKHQSPSCLKAGKQGSADAQVGLMYAEPCFLLCLSQLSHAQLSFCLPVYTRIHLSMHSVIRLYTYTPLCTYLYTLSFCTRNHQKWPHSFVKKWDFWKLMILGSFLAFFSFPKSPMAPSVNFWDKIRFLVFPYFIEAARFKSLGHKNDRFRLWKNGTLDAWLKKTETPF